MKKYKVEFMRTVNYSTHIIVERAMDEDDAEVQESRILKESEAAGTTEWKKTHSRIDAVDAKKTR